MVANRILALRTSLSRNREYFSGLIETQNGIVADLEARVEALDRSRADQDAVIAALDRSRLEQNALIADLVGRIAALEGREDLTDRVEALENPPPQPNGGLFGGLFG